MLPVSLPDLEQALTQFIPKQRWYRAKARTITSLRVADVIQMSNTSHLLVILLGYQEGDKASYLLPVATQGNAPVVEGVLHDALHDPEFRNLLFEAVACQQSFEGESGKFSSTRTQAFDRDCAATESLQSSVSRAEQSNSSIIFGQRYILKLFRKLEVGVNPDIEIGKYLTKSGFKNTPAVLGDFAYRPHAGEQMQAGILMQFVPNLGDAWKYTLDSLRSFFQLAFTQGDPPPLPTANPMELFPHRAAQAARETMGEYLQSAQLLGSRTAEMHAALSAGDEPGFEPEAFTLEYAEHLCKEMLDQAEVTFDLLRDKQEMLSGEPAEDARHLIAEEASVREQFTKLRHTRVQALRIRHHGDYHLGQVLWTGNDFVIIDFEGEPARPLAARRIKTFAMRDVAGMVRSFSYAGYAALFGQIEGVHVESANRVRIEEWAGFWAAWASAAYLRGYFGTAAGAPFVGLDEQEHRTLFDAFTLQKGLYEVAYELNNRPEWVQIPLRGILNLIGNHGRRTQFA